MRRAVHLVIRGHVQGVGYRAWVVDEAARLGLDGWVRNRVDGTVEAVVAGDDDAVERFVAAARSGPRMARVTAVDMEDVPASERVGPGFEVRPTV